MKKALLIGAGVALIGSAGVAATTTAMGGGSSWNWHFGSNRTDKFDAELAGSLATEFSLNEEDVAAVIEKVRDNQFNVYDAKQEAKLQKALTNEKITQEQYDTIVEKLTAIDALIDQVDDAEGEAKKTLLGDIKTAYKELYQWLKDEELSRSLIVHSPYSQHKHKHHDGHWNKSNHRR